MPFEERPEDVFLFDLEWITRQEAYDALLPLHQTPRNVPPIAPESATAGGEDLVRKIVKDYNPTGEWLYQALEMETTYGKNRKGVTKIIKDSIDEISCPLPDKVAGMAEAVTPICMSWCLRETRLGEWSEIYQTWGETNVVKIFWDLCRTRIPCGYAIETADLPVILAASARLKGVEDCAPTTSFDFFKSWNYVDVMKKRFGRNPNPCRLEDLAVATGYQGEKDPLKDGSEIARAYAEDRHLDILAHNKLDVAKLLHVYKHGEGVWW